MTEIDVFESQFLTAYRRYLDEAPSADVAAIAQAAVRARQRTGWHPWPMSYPFARAIALVVITALMLLALIAAAIFVGSQQPALGFVCPTGSHPDTPGPADQVRPPVAYVLPMAFDSRRGQIVALTTNDHASYATWTFDICTNTWQEKASVSADGRVGTTGMIAYDQAAGFTVALAGGHAWTYDLAVDRWTPRGLAPAALTYFGRFTYDWNLRRIIGLAAGDSTSTPAPTAPLELWSYDLGSDTWDRIEQAGVPTQYSRPIFAYDESVDRLIVYDAGRPPYGTWIVDARTGTWTQTAGNSPTMTFSWAVSGGEIAYDEDARQVVAYSGGTLLSYDAIADDWRVLAERDTAGVPDIARPTLVYDSVNHRIVVLGSDQFKGGRWIGGSDVFALDVATGKWTTLLEAK